jgi:poly(A) polymerase
VNERILNRLSPPQRETTARLAAAFGDASEELFLVGGFVRDAILENPLPADLDFATSASPERTRELIELAGAAAVYVIGERFGTVGAIFNIPPERLNVEITTYRQETYPDDTRFPVVEFTVSLVDDLARRDFTMNAIAADAASGAIVDPWGGEADIALALIRAVGDPAARFAEDPLRLLRAARFVAQLGFRIDWQTERAMAEQAESLERISRERIFGELTRLIVGPFADHGLDVLRRTGLIKYALPELEPLVAEANSDLTGRFGREKDLWDHTLKVLMQAPPRSAVRWAALLHDAAKPLTRSVGLDGEIHFFGHERVGADLASQLLARLNTDKALRSSVRTLVELHGRPASYDDSWTDSAVRRLALDAGDDWADLLDLAAADVTSGRERKRLEAAKRVARLRAHFLRLQQEADLAQLESPLDGHELMQLFALPPGPWIKAVKEHLRELVIEGEIKPDDRDKARRIAEEFMMASTGHTGAERDRGNPARSASR